MPLPRAPVAPSDAAEAARILRAKSPCTPDDFRKLDAEAKKRAITVTGEVSLDAIRSMRDALAKAKADGVPYREFVATAGKRLGEQWGIDSPQLKTIFVNNVQQAANQAIVARLNRQRGKYPFWTLDVVHDEVTSSWCSYFETYPVVLPAGHSWWAKNAPMRHHRCRSTLRGLTASEAKKIGISKSAPNWPPQEGWGGSAPLGAYKANMTDMGFPNRLAELRAALGSGSLVVPMADRYAHIDFSVPKGVREEAQRGLDWRKEHGRGGTAVGVATARTLVSAANVSPAKARHIARYFPRHEVDKKAEGFRPGEEGFPSNGRIAWALWSGDPGRAWAEKLVAQMDAADRKAKTMKDKKVTADLGQGDVHTDGPVKVRRMKPFTTEQRKALPDQQFALPETRQYPIHDAAHARNAMARLEQNKASLSPQQYAKAKANILRAYKRFGIKPGSTVAGGGRRLKHLKVHFSPSATHIEVRHMSDRIVQCAGVELDARLLEASDAGAEPPKRVWNQLTKCGSFRGHPAGPFEITPQINAEIVANFRATQNQRIPIDFEHASEQDPTSGAIPTEGAPAQGWIVDLDNRGAAGLWGLVEWLEPARSYVRQGKYKFFSPAIRFGAKDRVSGQPIGARMTSGALTNNPFLDGMQPLAASDRGGGAAVGNMETNTNMGDYAYSMAEMAPRLRACLFDPGTHQATMGTLAECYDAVCRLEALVDEFRETNPGADLMSAKHAGVDLGGALMRLRDALQMGLGVTVPEMLALVKQMIQEAIGVHEEEMHTDEEAAISSRVMGDRTMDENTIKLRDAESKLVALMNDNATLNAKLRDAESNAVTLADRVKTLEGENARLMSAQKARDEQDERSAIEDAFATYKDVKRLSDGDKAGWMLTLYRANPEQFKTTFPPVRADQRHLMRAVVPPGGARPTPGQAATEVRAIMGGGLSPQGMIELADKIQAERKCSREEALALAHKQAAPQSLRRPNPFGMPGIG